MCFTAPDCTDNCQPRPSCTTCAYRRPELIQEITETRLLAKFPASTCQQVMEAGCGVSVARPCLVLGKMTSHQSDNRPSKSQIGVYWTLKCGVSAARLLCLTLHSPLRSITVCNLNRSLDCPTCSLPSPVKTSLYSRVSSFLVVVLVNICIDAVEEKIDQDDNPAHSSLSE